MNQQPMPTLQVETKPTGPPPRPAVRLRTLLLQACDQIYPLCLWIAGLLLAALIIVIVFGQTKWPVLPSIVPAIVILIEIGFPLLLLSQFRSVELGWIGIGLGFAFNYSPLLLAMMAAYAGVPSDDALLHRAYVAFPRLGVFLLIISPVFLFIGYTLALLRRNQIRLAQLHQQERDGKGRVKVSFIPKCWETTACRDAVREICPHYRDAVPCWKRHNGCLCDHTLAGLLLNKHAQQSGQLGSNALDLTPLGGLEEYAERVKKAKARPWSEQREYCHVCPAFDEHQQYKYRNLNWMFLPLTILLIAGMYPLFHEGYLRGIQYLEELTKRLIAEDALPLAVAPDASNLINSPYEYLLLVTVALLVMSYVIEFTDNCLLKWKL